MCVEIPSRSVRVKECRIIRSNDTLAGGALIARTNPPQSESTVLLPALEGLVIARIKGRDDDQVAASRDIFCSAQPSFEVRLYRSQLAPQPHVPFHADSRQDYSPHSEQHPTPQRRMNSDRAPEWTVPRCEKAPSRSKTPNQVCKARLRRRAGMPHPSLNPHP